MVGFFASFDDDDGAAPVVSAKTKKEPVSAKVLTIRFILELS
jgi:hypothetical protein